MARIRKCLALWLAVVAAAGCSDIPPGPMAGGGGVETTEGNLASLSASTAGARVSLIPVDFDPLVDSLPDSLTALADAHGVYRFHGLAPGRYNLEAHLPSTGARCFRPGLAIAPGVRAIPGTDTLVAPGRLRILRDGIGRGVLMQKGRRFRLDLTGMQADSGGVILDSLPAGLLPPFYLLDGADSARIFRTDSVRILPGRLDSVAVTEEWAHSALLIYDTTYYTSLYRTGDLEGYPMLVRLTGAGFPFAEASPDGSDIRFRTLEGDPIPHVVESWDPATGRAEAWVRLKTGPGITFGSLRMDWGNPAARYRPGAVFDTFYGDAGVWHLNDKTSGGQDPLGEAGPFALPTTAVNLLPASSGVIGSAQRFDGLGAYASAPLPAPLRMPGLLGVSAWIAPDTAGLLGRTPPETLTIVSDWNASDSTGFYLAYLPESHSIFLALGFGGKVTRMNPYLSRDSGQTWHQVGATYDGEEVAVYSRGAQVSTWPAGPGPLPFPTGEYQIGARRSARPGVAREAYFRGAIDEVRVFRAVPGSFAWFSMDYKFQQPGAQVGGFQRLR